MPVDKAFEESMQKHFGKVPPLFYEQKNTLENIRYDYYSGYEAGQKTISPEVRDVLEAIAKPEQVLSVTSITYLRCRFCYKTGAIGESIEHKNFCTVPKIEKLLAKE